MMSSNTSFLESNWSCNTLHIALLYSGITITVCSIISIPLNFMILWVYWNARYKLKPIYLPIINVVLSDILSGLVGLSFRGPGMIDIKRYYNGQNCHDGLDCDTGLPCDSLHCNIPSLFCNLSPYFAWVFAYQNASAVSIMSVDRFMATCFPFWYRSNMSFKKSMALISITWLTTLAYAVYHSIAYFGLNLTSILWVTEYGRCMYVRYQTERCPPELDDLKWSNIDVQIIEEIVFFVLPVLVTIVMYSAMIYTIYFKKRMGFKENKKLVWISLAIIVNSFMPWILYFYLVNLDKGRNQAAMITSFVFFYITPLTNPIIVSMRSKAFKKFWLKDRIRTLFYVTVPAVLPGINIPVNKSTDVVQSRKRNTPTGVVLENEYAP